MRSTLKTAEAGVAGMFPAAKPWLADARAALDDYEKLIGDVAALRGEAGPAISVKIDAILKGH